MEYEVKLPVPGHDAVRQRLGTLGATLVGVEEQADTYFSHPCRDLGARDEALRLRRTSNGMELTFKGAKRGGPVKARPETNLPLSEDPSELLQCLGFRANARLHKRREGWLLQGTEVSLDHVEGLGHFVEIEALPDTQDAADAVITVQGLLGLQEVASTLRSYLDLAMDARADAVETID